jgi:hypothetical protein
MGKRWVYDGISPFIPKAVKVTGNNMQFPLIGRGDVNPLKQVDNSCALGLVHELFFGTSSVDVYMCASSINCQ